MDCFAHERILEVRNFLILSKKIKRQSSKDSKDKATYSTYIKYLPSKRFKLGKYTSYAWQCG